MRLVIHRGTEEVGASCIEVRAGNTRIFLDAGLPLDGGPSSPPKPLEGADALFISHGHPDHCGLLECLPADVPVYMNDTAKLFAEASAVFRKEAPSSRATIPLMAGREVQVGDIAVTPWLMDHSAPDALGFHVRGEGRQMFYTGDFRAHGRKAWAFDRLLANPPGPLDALITEGTLLERSNAKFPDETSVEAAMAEAFRAEPNLALVVCSGQNLDRLVTVFRAAKRSGRTLVLDLYTAWVLELVARAHKGTPRMGWEGVRVLAHGREAARQYGIVKNAPDYFGDFRSRVYAKDVAISMKDIVADPGRFVLKTNQPLPIIERSGLSSASVVYSLWQGYLKPEKYPRQAAEFKTLESREGVTLRHIHTSGHADLATLKTLAEGLRPGVLIPIHTEHKAKFPEHFANVLLLDDGEEAILGKAEPNHGQGGAGMTNNIAPSTPKQDQAVLIDWDLLEIVPLKDQELDNYLGERPDNFAYKMDRALVAEVEARLAQVKDAYRNLEQALSRSQVVMQAGGDGGIHKPGNPLAQALVLLAELEMRLSDNAARKVWEADPECSPEWGGAGVVVSSDPQRVASLEEHIFTLLMPDARPVAWMMYKLRDVCADHYDYANKYDLFRALAQAAKDAGAETATDMLPVWAAMIQAARNFLEGLEKSKGTRCTMRRQKK